MHDCILVAPVTYERVQHILLLLLRDGVLYLDVHVASVPLTALDTVPH